MTTVDQLKDALKETLEENGSMKKLRAHARAEIFKALDDTEQKDRPQPGNDQFIINELIREYMNYHEYNYSLQVFTPESGQPESQFNQTYLRQQLGMDDSTTTEEPLLYSLLAAIRRMRRSSPQSQPPHFHQGVPPMSYPPPPQMSSYAQPDFGRGQQSYHASQAPPPNQSQYPAQRFY
ncbi:putative fop amine-terminal dimerization domain protein [Blattamonas nauphoetae]|uniref:Fop amine-terminal dimerization domain protein n=1 Tax=Blattamonas nauphoetae TaxID=2049346 RepID=A0ABQ9X4S1_9EUKA|nr:putative fop amine-terminal dimerization domain protein [Blattamonas nauphoetae]